MAPPLLPIFRSRAQAVVLAELLLKPDAELTLTDLAKRADASLSSVHAEVERLAAAEVVRDRFVGRARLVRANTDNPAVRPLRELVALTFGPVVVVREAFRDVPGVYQVVLFGSWAARYSGESGPPPNDIDVLVVGAPNRADVYDAADAAQQRLGLPVNPVIASRERWRKSADPLMRQVNASPTVTVLDVA